MNSQRCHTYILIRIDESFKISGKINGINQVI